MKYSDWPRYLVPAGWVIFLVWMVYGTAVDMPFVHHDSLRYFGKHFLPSEISDPSDPYFECDWALGRPLAAWTGNLIFHQVGDFSGLAFVRCLGVGIACIFACLAAWILRRAGHDRWSAVLMGVWVAVLPGFQDRVMMPMPYYGLGAVGALMAYLIWTSELPVLGRITGTAVFLLSSLFCYPVVSCLFLSFLSVDLLWCKPERWGIVRRRILEGLLCLAVCAAAYFVFAKLVLLPRFPQALEGTFAAYQMKPDVAQIPAKMVRLLVEGAGYVFNPFSPQGGVLSGQTVFFFILLVLTMDRSFSWGQRKWRLLLWLTLWAGSVAVWAVSPMNFWLYRVLFPGAVMSCFALVWGIGHLMRDQMHISPRTTGTVVVLITAVAILLAGRNLNMNVWNANSEMTFIRSQLAKARGPDLRRIHVIEPLNDGYGFNGQKVMDDVNNMNSVNYEFELTYLVKMGLWGQIANRPLWHCMERQEACVARVPEGVLLLTHSKPGEQLFVSEHMVVIDFNDMVLASKVFR